MLTITEITEIVGAITYKPGWHIDLYQNNGRPYVQLHVSGRDSSTKEWTTWKSGKRHLSFHMCRQEIVSAVFGLITDAEMHEAREWFRYRKASIFNPHLDPDVLAEVARKRSSFVFRENAMTMEEAS